MYYMNVPVSKTLIRKGILEPGGIFCWKGTLVNTGAFSFQKLFWHFFFPSWQGQCLKRDLIFFLPALGPPQLLAGGLSRGWHCTRARAAPCQGSAASCAAWQSLARHKTGLYKTKPIPLPAEACVQRLAQPAEQQAVVAVSTAGHRAQHPAGAHSGLIAGTLAPLTASTGRCHLCH